MKINRYQPHVFVLPEDDADRQLANGFLRDPYLLTHKIQVLVPAEGWMKVLECFKSEHVREMETCPHRLMVLLIDFDRDEDRLKRARAFIPDHLIDRVFVLGAWRNPEKLKASLGRSLETIGMELAKDCREETDAIWAHELLQHNASELSRLRERVRPFLFPL
jgi:hypothetical protein